MPSCRNMPSMPKVRDSSGTIGTISLPMFLSRTSVPSICTIAIVVEISRSPELCSRRSKFDSGGAVSEVDLRRRSGRKPPSFARLAHAEALHRLGEDHGRLVLVLYRSGVSGIDLERIVPAAVELPHLVIR